MRRWLAVWVATALALVGSIAGPVAPAAATVHSWPSGWGNPSVVSRYNDWGFNVCGGEYVAGWAHLGADSQGAPSGSDVRAIGPGSVKAIVGYSTGKAAVVEHASAAGAFVAVYGHIDPTVGVGASVSTGSKLGTVAYWANNSHLHFSVIPGAYRSGMHLSGYRDCNAGQTGDLGYVNPIPWLAANGPAGGDLADGSLVDHGGHVYRIVGGAPIWVSSWDVVGGPKPTRSLSAAEFGALRKYPADGTFLNGHKSGRVYRVAGGAPVYVSAWKNVGGPQPVVTVDDAAIDNAGGTGLWSHLRKYPADGTLISGGGRVYVVAGGAPLYVFSWAGIGGSRPVVVVDEVTIANAGDASLWSNLRATPSNMFIVGHKSGRVFRVYDGHPYYVSSWAPFGGAQPVTSVDDQAIDGCDHLNCSPFGDLNRAVGSAGEITVEGWAMDPNTTAPVEVHISVDGTRVGTAQANVSRPDVDATFHRGAKFGFKTTVPAAAGSHRVCVDAINVGNGANHRIGCRDVTVVALQTLGAPTPTISGAAQVGTTLSAQAGEWKPSPVALAYQWLRDGSVISGATKSTYSLVAADAGKRVSVRVTGSRAGYTTVSKTSAQTAAVAAAPKPTPTPSPSPSPKPTPSPSPSPSPSGKEFTAVSVPRITGSVKVGKKLTADVGAWGPGDVALSYQWYRSGAKIAKATSSTYKLVAADRGKKITVKVTGMKPGYTTVSKTSVATKKVAAGSLTSVTPKISGTVKMGKKLTARPGTWKPSGVKLSYQWLRNGKAIKGATKSVYKLAKADKGKKITVKVTGKKAGYTTKSSVSKATKKVG